MMLTVILVTLMTSHVMGDYDCVCNFNVEIPVYLRPDDQLNPAGYMYEFDCKSVYPQTGSSSALYYAIQFEKKVVYVKKQTGIKLQQCPGDPSGDDKVPNTTIPPSSVRMTTILPTTIRTTMPPTTRAPIITTTTRAPTTTTPSTMAPTTTKITRAPTTMTTTKATTTSPTTMAPTTTTTTKAKTTTHTTMAPTTATPPTRLPITTTTTKAPTTSQTTRAPTTTPTTMAPTTTHTTMAPTTATPPTRLPITTHTTMAPTTTIATKAPRNSPTTMAPTTMTTTPTTLVTTISPSTTTPFITTTVMQSTVPAATHMSPVGTMYETIGKGYNLLTGTPDQSKDNGLIDRHIFQVTGNNEMGEVNHRQYNTCKSESSTFLVHSSRTYQNELLQYVTPSSGHHSNLINEALSYSTGFASVKHATELSNPEIVYTDVKSACITDELSADLNYTQITSEFATAVCSLPLDILSNLTAYMSFIDTWGTSIVTDTSIGHGTIVRYSLDLQKIFQMLRQKGATIQNGGPFRGFSSSLITTPAQVQGLHNVGSQTHTTTIGSQTNYQPLQLNIVPIFQALDPTYWEPVMGQLMSSGKCPDSLDSTMLAKYQSNLNETLSLYTGYYHTKIGYTRTATDHPLQIPVTWPLGKYGLMQAASGCPGASTLWQTGWRKQDTEDLRNGNHFSSGITQYLSGEFNKNIQTRYCIRNTAKFTSYDIDWPKGTYCIMRKGGVCPNGFRWGSIFWDDEDVFNKNNHGGALPDGNYGRDTKIYYCCRNDAPSSTEIALPVDRSFVLFRYSSPCQRVHGMTSRDVHVRWDDDDTSNHDKVEGAHPLDNGGSNNHDIYFCHYHRSAGVPIIG